MSRRFGVTIAEIIVAFAFLSLGVLVMVGLALTSLRVSSKSDESSRALSVGNQFLEEQIRQALADTPAGTRQSFFDQDDAVNPWRSQEQQVGRTRFQLRLRLQTVRSASGAPLGSASDPNNRLKRAEVLVTWWVDGEAANSRNGYGKLETSITRLVSENQL